jgi:hypothetical protein
VGIHDKYSSGLEASHHVQYLAGGDRDASRTFTEPERLVLLNGDLDEISRDPLWRYGTPMGPRR